MENINDSIVRDYYYNGINGDHPIKYIQYRNNSVVIFFNKVKNGYYLPKFISYSILNNYIAERRNYKIKAILEHF